MNMSKFHVFTDFILSELLYLNLVGKNASIQQIPVSQIQLSSNV